MIKQISNDKELSAVVAEYAKIENHLAKAEAELNLKINKIKIEAEAQNAEAKGRAKALGMLIEGYCGERKAEITANGARSMDLPSGTIGWRASSKVVISNSQQAAVIAKIKSMGRFEALNIKETPNKDVLASWGQEALAEIGIRKEDRDEFFIKVNPETV